MTDENTRLPSDSVVEAIPPIHEFHKPTKQGAPEIAYLALAIFRSSFADDEDERLVLEKWNEWIDERADYIRTARFVLNALGGNGSVVKALAAQPRDDVRELLEDCRKGLNVLHSILTVHGMQGGADTALALRDRIDTALSQTDEQPAIPDMTDAECATAYRDLRKRANDAGFATVGEWIDEQPDTDGLAQELRRWIVDGLGVFADSEPDFAMSYGIRHLAADQILGRPWPTALRTDRKAVLEEAAKVCDEMGAAEQESFGLNRAAQNYFRARNAIRALAEGTKQ